MRRMLKRKPPGRSGQPRRSSREQQSGGEVWLQQRKDGSSLPALSCPQPRAAPHQGREQSEGNLHALESQKSHPVFAIVLFALLGFHKIPQESSNMCTTYRQGQCHPKGSCKLTSPYLPTRCTIFLKHLQSVFHLLQLLQGDSAQETFLTVAFPSHP